jgi:hypothetical protein
VVNVLKFRGGNRVIIVVRLLSLNYLLYKNVILSYLNPSQSTELSWVFLL